MSVHQFVRRSANAMDKTESRRIVTVNIVCLLVRNTPLLKLRTHAQTRIHALSAADAFADPSEIGKGGKERRRSLHDGGGRTVFLSETTGKVPRALKNVRNISATNPQIPQTHRRLCVWAAAANEPMRDRRRGHTTARYVAVNNAMMVALPFTRARSKAVKPPCACATPSKHTIRINYERFCRCGIYITVI
jgi:hypothetical protein